MASSAMLHRVPLVRTDVSEEFSAFILRVTRIGELGTTLAVTSNGRTLRCEAPQIMEINTNPHVGCYEYECIVVVVRCVF
jgi:hypothetical protein